MRGLLHLSLWIAFATAGTACSNGITGSQNQGQSIELDASQANGIFGGQVATGREPFAKHIVALYDFQVGGLCTASILSDSLLLTAAHCVTSKPQNLAVLFGTQVDSPSTLQRRVVDYRISPLYPFRQFTGKNNGDIAVVRFRGGLPAGYQPITYTRNRSLLVYGQRVLLAGFGASTILWDVDPKTGETKAKPSGSGTLRFVTTTVDNAFFTESEFLLENSKSEGACHGDSGGPAYSMENGRLVLVGVTNGYIGDPSGACGGKMVYASTAFYDEWIRQTSAFLMTL